MVKETAGKARFTVFETPIGHAGLAWSRRGVTRFLLPEATAAETEQRMHELCPGAELSKPQGWVADLVGRVRLHLAGTPDSFLDVPLDSAELPPFFAAVYESLRKVPAGATTTYGSLGRKIGGSTAAARAVGTAMAKNPFALLVPCHRVVGSDGKLHGFSAHGGLVTKARLLAIEGRPEPEQGTLFGEAETPVKEAARPSSSARRRNATRGG